MEKSKSLIEIITPMQQLVEQLQFQMQQILAEAKRVPEPYFIGSRLYYKLVENPRTWEEIYANIEAVKVNLNSQIDEAFYMERMWRNFNNAGFFYIDRGIQVRQQFNLIIDRTT